MGAIELENILITPLAQIKTLGGDVLHVLKSEEKGFVGFGEAYFSMVEDGRIKAWKRHTKMVMNLVVPIGMVRFVFHSEFKHSPHNFRVIEIGRENYLRITVPPGIWFGFQGLRSPYSLILNVSNLIHDPNEIERRTMSEIIYDWN